MILLKVFGYLFMLYGITEIVIYGRGPFGICEWWRNFAHKISNGFGQLFTCPLCFSTWLGILCSVVNILIFPTMPFTIFNIAFGTGLFFWNSLLVVLLDMGASAGFVWFMHEIEEMLEHVGNKYEDIEEDNNYINEEKDDEN